MRLQSRITASVVRSFATKTPSSSSCEEDEDCNSIPIEGQFKNPIVAKLWAARLEAKARLGLSDGKSGGGSSTTDVTKAAAQVVQGGKDEEQASEGKAPSESTTEISYPFSTDEILKEGYANPWGEMRFGKVIICDDCLVLLFRSCVGDVC